MSKVTSFDDFYAEVVAEAEAEGPEAVAQLRMLEDRYRLASDLIGLRLTLNMTQQQLAAASGIRQSEISRIESGNGNPTLKTIGALARALGAEIHLSAG
ncbi:MAG: helix-turn-helix transcriptional regulator [Thermoleophilia bacterium]|nr:helix-turn-helix transcriptional regulator [Thermoleophilia bacterium]